MKIISNQAFSYDAEKYVYQKNNPFLPGINHGELSAKPFKVTSPDRTKKNKKDVKKEKEQGKKPRPFNM